MKKFIVVGAGKGIGLQIATILAEGNQVSAISRNSTSELDQLNIRFYPIDVGKDDLESLGDLPEIVHGLAYCPG